MYRGTINTKIILAVFSCVGGAHVAGTLLALHLRPSTAHELGCSQAPICHALIFSSSKKIWSTRKPYTYLSSFPVCFNMALWPSWYGESCACEHALMSVTDSRAVGQIQGDPFHKGPDSVLTYICASSIDFNRNFVQLSHYVTAGFRCKKFCILLELNIIYKMQIEAQKQHKEDDSVHKRKVNFHDSEVKHIFIF